MPATATQPNAHTLRVLQLDARDFKRLRAFQVTPGGKSLIVIKGPNEAGKTSAIDALIAALAGARRIPEQPIRTGAESSTVRVVLGDDGPRYAVTRSFKGDRSYLAVKAITPDGEAKLSAAQGFLAALTADISFDPLAFAKAKPADQIRMLFAAINAGDAYELAQGRRRTLYDQRTEINRGITALEAKLKANPDPDPARTLVETPDAEFAKRLADAQAHNARCQQLTVAIEQRNSRIAVLRDQLRVIQEQIGQLEGQNRTDSVTLARMPAEVDTAQIAAAIARNSQANELARRQAVARRTAAELAEQRKAADAKTAAMEAIDAELRRTIEASNIGQTVPGLTVTAAGEIQHNGVPFSQASGMRALEVSCLIGMASNPKLRVMTIDEGDRLDPGSLARLEQIAREHDFQVFMTAVYAGAEGDNVHVCELADGLAVGAAPPAAEAGTSKGNGHREVVAVAADPGFEL